VFRGADITALRPWELVERGIAGTFQKHAAVPPSAHHRQRHVPLVAPRARRGGEWVKSIEAKAMDAARVRRHLRDMALEQASALSARRLKRLEVAAGALPPEPELLLLDERRRPEPGRIGAARQVDPPPAQGRSLRQAALRSSRGADDRAQAEELMAIVDRVIVVDYGEIIADGHPPKVVRNPKVIEATGERACAA